MGARADAQALPKETHILVEKTLAITPMQEQQASPSVETSKRDSGQPGIDLAPLTPDGPVMADSNPDARVRIEGEPNRTVGTDNITSNVSSTGDSKLLQGGNTLESTGDKSLKYLPKGRKSRTHDVGHNRSGCIIY